MKKQKIVLEDTCRIHVKFSEIDMMRRAWHGSYVTYFEDGRESFGRHYQGIGYDVIAESGMFAPIVDLHVKYYGPLCMNDVAVVTTRYVYHRGARLDYEYEVHRESDGLLCATGTTTQLFIDRDEQLMLDKPDYYKKWQEKFGIFDA